MTRQGMERPGNARQGKEFLKLEVRRGWVRLDVARHGRSRLGMARHGRAA